MSAALVEPPEAFETRVNKAHLAIARGREPLRASPRSASTALASSGHGLTGLARSRLLSASDRCQAVGDLSHWNEDRRDGGIDEPEVEQTNSGQPE